MNKKQREHYSTVIRKSMNKAQKVFSSVPGVVVLSILIGVIGGVISYQNELKKYQNEINSYPVEIYDHLEAIAQDVIEEKKSIDLLAIPDEIVYKIEQRDEIIIFSYSVKDWEKRYAPVPSTEIILSKQLEILSKASNMPSNEEYMDNIKKEILSSSFSSGIILIPITLLVILLCEILFNQWRENEKEKN